ncbi:unnamed protein product [Oncorhynchus mykiss]|uniref:WDR11 first beta-propeller domain-containing protein n=1 Tax=Oncorhynchus mykiss TaxID=8022 RepID=A0A060XNE7_ONCMY|nr:unnamed protein product [Oncorhynchus mykiss]
MFRPGIKPPTFLSQGGHSNRNATELVKNCIIRQRNTCWFKVSQSRAEAVTLNADCLQLSYLPSKRNHMLLLYPREILILDLELSQTVGVVAIERSGVPFIQVIPCAQRDALFCLHENGCITLRVCRSTTAPDESGKHPSTVTHTVSQSSLKNKNSSISVTHSFHSSIFSQKELIYSHTLCPSNQMYLYSPSYIS